MHIDLTLREGSAVNDTKGRKRAEVLVVDDEADVCEFCKDVFVGAGFSVQTAQSARDALKIVDRTHIDIVFSDLKMPNVDGIELLRLLKRRSPDMDVVLMTGYATIETAVLAIQMGASDYITKPLSVGDLETRVHRLATWRDRASDNPDRCGSSPEQVGALGLVGTSLPMQEVYRTVRCYARKRQPVLIMGESGTGKELIARSIHKYGANPDEPYVPVDCSAMNANLVESELFGHRRGAFTGATQDRPGLLASAGKGTAFLDEIGELPLDLQSKLLRALQEKEFRPVGSNRPVPLEARIVAATNRNLLEAVQAGTFRLDLYYRLNVLTVRIPALRERRCDIPALVQYFIMRHSGPGDGILGVEPGVMEGLMRYSWPGNVRELQNLVQRALAVASGPLLKLSDFQLEIAEIGSVVPSDLSAPPKLSVFPREIRSQDRDAGRDRYTHMEQLERDAIIHAMEDAQGRRARAAAMLGLGKTTIYRKLKRYGLEDFKSSRAGSGSEGRPVSAAKEAL